MTEKIPSAVAFIAALWAGVYLCLHDFPVLGGWVCILCFFCSRGFEKIRTK